MDKFIPKFQTRKKADFKYRLKDVIECAIFCVIPAGTQKVQSSSKFFESLNPTLDEQKKYYARP
jgi:hypothetical protein